MFSSASDEQMLYKFIFSTQQLFSDYISNKMLNYRHQNQSFFKYRLIYRNIQDKLVAKKVKTDFWWYIINKNIGLSSSTYCMELFFPTSHNKQYIIKDKWLCPVSEEKHGHWYTDDEVGVYQVFHTGVFLEGTRRSLWRRRLGFLSSLLLHSTDPEQSRFEFRWTRIAGRRTTGVCWQIMHSELQTDQNKYYLHRFSAFYIICLQIVIFI